MFRIGVNSRRLNSRIFGLANKDLWRRLYQLRAGPETRSGMVPVRPDAAVRYFGRYRAGWIRGASCCRSPEGLQA